MSHPDPFAAVQAPSAPASTVTPNSTPSAGDGFTAATTVDDPFATSSTLRGDFTPSPKLDDLLGRLVIMIPRTFDPAAKDPNDPTGVKTRELFTVDLVVLTGGPLSFQYKAKGDPEKGIPDEYKTWTVDEMPAAWSGYWVPQGAIIGKLKECAKQGVPFLGVPTRMPTSKQRQSGVSKVDVEREYQAWVKNGKPGNRPLSAWQLDDPSTDVRGVAVQWWKDNRNTIAPIGTMTF